MVHLIVLSLTRNQDSAGTVQSVLLKDLAVGGFLFCSSWVWVPVIYSLFCSVLNSFSQHCIMKTWKHTKSKELCSEHLYTYLVDSEVKISLCLLYYMSLSIPPQSKNSFLCWGCKCLSLEVELIIISVISTGKKFESPEITTILYSFCENITSHMLCTLQTEFHLIFTMIPIGRNCFPIL